MTRLDNCGTIENKLMLHLRIVAILIVEPLNDVTDGTWDEFDNLAAREKKEHEPFGFNLWE